MADLKLMEATMEVDTPILNENILEKAKLNELIPKGREELSYADIIQDQEPRYENKGGAFTTGIDIFSEEEQKKMEERAKRFGIKNGTKPPLENVEDLYLSMGVYNSIDNAKFVRLNTLHMRGTEDMSTQDVFNYFKDYSPSSIEWINDVSCNVVWLDKISAARALIYMSKKIVNKSKDNDQQMIGENTDEKVESLNEIDINDINFPIPPGIWRKGVDCSKSKTILLRFATNLDKKQIHSEKLSEYYKKYGNPNFGGMRGILTHSRKRMYKQTRMKVDGAEEEEKGEENDESNDDINNSDNKKRRIKNPWGSLSQTWGQNDSVEKDYSRQNLDKKNDDIEEILESSIKERLGFKSQNRDADSDSGNSNEEDWNRRSKIMRMRMHADDEEEKMQRQRLRQLTNKVHEKIFSNDLRSKLGRNNNNTINNNYNNRRRAGGGGGERAAATANNYHNPIQFVIKNNANRFRSRRVEEEEEEEDDDEEEIDYEEKEVNPEVEEMEEATVAFKTKETFGNQNDDSEKEEGEWEEPENEEDVRDESREVDLEEEEEGGQEDQEDPDDSDSGSSDISEKEVQGPKGSVIKVVSRPKPRIASTVWARLNNTDAKKPTSDKKDLRETLKGNLKSRLGYERSPLRITINIKPENESE